MEIKQWGHFQQCVFIQVAFAEPLYLGFFHACLLGQGFGIDSKAELGFTKDVFKEIFYRKGHLFLGLGGAGGGGGFAEVGTLFFGVVGGADKWTGFDYVVANFQAVFFPILEFFRGDPAVYRRVFCCRLEILAQGENVDASISKVLKGFAELVRLFANAQHQAGFGGESSFGSMAEDFEGLFVSGGFANGFLEAFDGFQVVIEDVGLGSQNDVQLVCIALKIRCEYFDGSIRATIANGSDGSCPDIGSTIFQIVSGYRSDDTMPQTHFCYRFSYSWRLCQIQFCRFPSVYGTKGAGSCADVAQYHHCRRTT